MGIRNVIGKYLNNHAETNENHWDDSLKTHYYKTTKDKGLRTLEDIFNKSSAYEINAVSAEHGEVSINVKKGKKAFVVATVVMVKPYQTAVDFSVTTESFLPFDLGYSTKLIKALYSEINQHLQLITDKK
ncbi:cytosolic protein [Oceanobacillus kapialis]